ncbi:MAG: GGDEF domain-containing protein, partial [Xanthomonadales bacterium]|nr:GGDEF domain-containing protein [Xanthomonadales bacterium]
MFRVTKEKQLDFPLVVELAGQYGVPLIVQLTPEDDAFFRHALDCEPLHLLNAQSDAQLIELVRLHMNSASDEVESGNLKKRISELEQQTYQLLEESEEAIAYQLEGLHIYANRAYQQMMEVSDATDLQTLSLLELAQGTEEDIKSILREISGGKFPEDSVRAKIRTTRGAEFNANLMFSPALMNGEECIQVRVRRQDSDVPLRHETEQSSEPDPVAGLSNRQVFIHELQAFVTQCQQEDKKGSLLYMEPENASRLARSMGFCAFNQVSTDLAAAISQHLSKQDLATPLGECAFAVLFKEDKGQRAAATFDEVVRSLGETGLNDVNIRAGMTPIATQTLSADEAMEQARLAFADAPTEGNSLARFKPQPPESGEQHDDQQWSDRIRHALNSESFYSVQVA